MKFLGRDLATYTKHLRHIHLYLWYFVRCCVIFKHPWRLCYAYLTQTVPPNKVIELRNGLKIFPSEQPEDVVTVFLIFVREDYGQVLPDSTVIDIGANIGIFALYAAYRQASKVYAYEPNGEAYQALQRNIAENHLEQRIIPHQLAVCDVEAGTVKFPKKSSIFNAIIADEQAQDFDWVATTTLDTIIAQTSAVNLLKLDCEGAEYDILFHASAETLRHISAIKLEYHHARTDELAIFLGRNGFAQTFLRVDHGPTGAIWFDKHPTD